MNHSHINASQLGTPRECTISHINASQLGTPRECTISHINASHLETLRECTISHTDNILMLLIWEHRENVPFFIGQSVKP